MAELAKAILVLPYSTAPVESTFSKFKALKTPYRNRLDVENLEASIIVEQSLSGEAFVLRPTMLEKYSNMWKIESQTNSAPKTSQINGSQPSIEQVNTDKKANQSGVLDALCENWFQAKAKQAQAEWLAIQAQSQLFQEEEIELVENHYSPQIPQFIYKPDSSLKRTISSNQKQGEKRLLIEKVQIIKKDSQEEEEESPRQISNQDFSQLSKEGQESLNSEENL